jgi:hypothetical protein
MLEAKEKQLEVFRLKSTRNPQLFKRTDNLELHDLIPSGCAHLYLPAYFSIHNTIHQNLSDNDKHEDGIQRFQFN